MKCIRKPRNLRYFWQSFIITLTGILCIGGLVVVQYNTQLISMGASAAESSYVPLPVRLNLSPLAEPPSVVSGPIIKMGALLPAPVRLVWEGTLGAAGLLEKLDKFLAYAAD